MLSGYYLINASSGEVLDEPGGSTTLGANIDQYQITGSANQQWQILPLSNGSSAIVNTQTNLAWLTRTLRPVACTRPMARPRSSSGNRSFQPGPAMADLAPSERHC